LIDRAARHGHQMNGKLARLAQQEAIHKSTSPSDISSCDTSSALLDRRQRQRSESHCQRQCTKSHKKKKKKKSLKRTGTEESWRTTNTF